MLELIERDALGHGQYAIDRIVDHRKLKNGNWEVKVRWTGYQESEDSWQTLNSIANDDPVTVTLYAVENDLLETSSRHKDGNVFHDCHSDPRSSGDCLTRRR